MLKDLNSRSLEIFSEIVETYIELGEPVGSRTLSKRLTHTLSPATIRNIMADLEDAGFLYAPHSSSGRVPTAEGLKFFVDGLLENHVLQAEDIALWEKEFGDEQQNVEQIIEKTSSILSGLSHCASLVIAPKFDQVEIKHVEFVQLSQEKALLILVSAEGSIENRIIDLPPGTTIAQLREASQYINRTFPGRTLLQMQSDIRQELTTQKNTLDGLVSKIVELGLAQWIPEEQALIVKGQANLLQNIHHLEDVERIRRLFLELDNKESVGHLIDASLCAQGIKMFIGSEHYLFQESGCAMVISPYTNAEAKIIGAIGVIGPMHMNYRRIIPMLDYSAKMISKLLSS